MIKCLFSPPLMIMIITFIIILFYNYVLLFTVHKTHIHDLTSLAKTHETYKAVLIYILQVRKLKTNIESFSPGC